MNAPTDTQQALVRPRRASVIFWSSGAIVLAVLGLLTYSAIQQARTAAIRSADK